jgi:transcriptional regulator with XRE-family HTH domain
MASSLLPNYLRANRKRLGLSQDEVAYLLGAGSGAKTSRYERFAREPGFRSALACEAVFQRPIRELFAGLYKKVEREVAGRAKNLIVKTCQLEPGRRTGCKRETLERIAAVKSKRQRNL